MSAFDRAIQLAKGQLPAAFTVGGGLPYSDGEAPRAIVPESDEGLLADRVVAIETINPTGTEDIEDFEDAVKEIGFEAIAFYISFHRPTPQGQWGIFYFDHRVRQFAEVVRREFQLKPDEAARQAFNIVRAHERFHFRFDVSALYHELILKKPLYNEYFASVYRTVYCTAECFEEALANRACLELPLIPRPRKSAWYIETRQSAMKPFLEKLFARLPPGYKDYGRPLNELCSGLGGQLFETKPSARLPKPQAGWASRIRPLRRERCPEFVLPGKVDDSGKSPEFTLKRGRHKWRVHKSDPDRWPSKPHAHDYEQNVKLDIRDGSVWDVTTREKVGSVKKRVLVELRDQIKRRFPDTVLDL